jgi:hypothetical protein
LADATSPDSLRISLDLTQELAPADDMLSFKLQTKVRKVRKNLSRSLNEDPSRKAILPQISSMWLSSVV